MDKIDLKILYELDKDARQPLSQIAKKIKTSKQTVKYRFDRLKKEKILLGTYAMINEQKLGKTAYRTFIKFGKITPELEKELINFIKQQPKLFWLASFYGKWDLVFQFLEDDIFTFEKTIQPILEKYESYFQERVMTIITELYEYPHQFLFDKKINFSLDLLGGFNKYKLDTIDQEILTSLAKDGRATSISIATKLNLTREAIQNRIRKLIKEKIIVGFRPNINFEKLGYLQIKVFLFFQTCTQEQEKRLLTRLEYHPNVVFVTKAHSLANREFELYVNSINQFYEMMNELRIEFGDIIRNYDSVIVHKVHITNYYPK